MSGAQTRKKTQTTDLPPGWVILTSKRNGNRKYYFNTLTKVSTWTHPCEGHQQDNVGVQQKETLKHKGESSRSGNFYNSGKKIKNSLEPVKKYSTYEKLNSKNTQNCIDYQDLSALTSGSTEKSSKKIEKNYGKTTISSSSICMKDKSKDCNLTCDNKLSKIQTHNKTPKVSSNFENKKNKSSALDLIKKNYLEETTLPQLIPKNQNDQVKEKKMLVTEGKVKKKNRKKNKKLKESIKNQTTELQNSNQLNSVYSKGKPVKFTIPKKNVKTENLLGSKCHSEVKVLDKTDCLEAEKNTFKPNFTGEKTLDFCQNESSMSLKDDFSEEMDWEACDEETDAKNINEFCEQMDTTKTISSAIFYEVKADSITINSSESQSWVLVLDTNILISCLNFVKEMKDHSVSGLGLPIFYIPWRVLQELDHLKNIRSYSSDKQLSLNARRAISYLNDNFKSGHPRFCGQSFQDYSKISDENSTPDDEILKTCLELKTLYNNINVMLLTNDKNLESKAHVCHIESYSKEKFQGKYLSSERNMQKICGTSDVKVQKVDTALNELKNALKKLFSIVVETEMKEAFDKDWLKICCRKPPWSLRDTLDVIKKHWIAVFFLIFDKEVLNLIDNLYLKLFREKTVTIKGFMEVLENVQKLMKKMKNTKRKIQYDSAIDEVVTTLSTLAQTFGSNTQVNNEILISENLNIVPNSTIPSESLNEYFNQVRDIFKWIWDSLKDFCDSLTALFASPIVNNNVLVPQTKQNVMQRYSELSKLIAFLEKGLELNVHEISNVHPVISHLNNFLVQALAITDSELQTKLPKCLAVFFSSSEGRSLITRSLCDFKEFSQTLLRANEFIERNYCNI